LLTEMRDSLDPPGPAPEPQPEPEPEPELEYELVINSNGVPHKVARRKRGPKTLKPMN
jgi:hypothetical protein